MLVETWNLAFPFVLLVLSLEVIFRMAASRNFPGKKRNSTLLKTTVCSKWWKFTQVIQILVKSSKMTFFWWLFHLQFVSLNNKNVKVTKGLFISKCLFCVFNFFQKMNENKSTSGIIVCSKVEFICCIFGMIHGLAIYFRVLLTFKETVCFWYKTNLYVP